MCFAVRDLHARIQAIRRGGEFPDTLQRDYQLYRRMDGWPFFVPD